MANEMSGKDLYVAFNGTAIAGDFRSFDTSQTVDVIDTSAGADVAKTYIASLEDGTASFGGLYLGTADPTWGWTMGTSGTLEWGEKGTAAGNPQEYIQAILNKRDIKRPYAGVIELSLGWQFNGTLVQGTY